MTMIMISLALLKYILFNLYNNDNSYYICNTYVFLFLFLFLNYNLEI